MAMTLMERANFRQKMQDEYGPEWEEIVTLYKQKVTPRYGPHGDYKGWDVDPTRFRSDNPLSLLSSREDIDAVLNKPTKQDYINELDQMSPDRLQGPVRPPMVRTGKEAGPIGPQLQEFNPTPSFLSSTRESVPWQPGFQNKINPYNYGYDQSGPKGKEGIFSQAYPGPSSDFPNSNMNTVGDAKSFNAAYNQSPGLLSDTTPGKSGWMSDERMLNAQNRKLRLAQMFLNFGEQSRNDDDGWGGPLTHYN